MYCLQLGFSSAQLRQGFGRLGASVGIFKLHEKLAGFYCIAIVDQHAFHNRSSQRVCLKILNRLNFSIGGDGAGNLLPRYPLCADGYHATAHLPAGEDQQRDNGRRHNQHQVVAFEKTGFFFSYHRGNVSV